MKKVICIALFAAAAAHAQGQKQDDETTCYNYLNAALQAEQLTNVDQQPASMTQVSKRLRASGTSWCEIKALVQKRYLGVALAK